MMRTEEKTPEQMQEEDKFFEEKAIIDEQTAKRDIIKLARLFQEYSNNEIFILLFSIATEYKREAERQYDYLKNFSIEKMLQMGETRYLMKRVELETRIKTIDFFINIPQNYIKRSKEILEQKE